MSAMLRKILFPRIAELLEADDPRRAIAEVHGSIVDQSMLATLVFAVPTLAAYLALNHWVVEAGAAVLSAGILLLAAASIFRRRISVFLRAFLVIAIWFAFGVTGLLCFGLAGSGFLFMISAGGLAALVFGPWIGSLTILAILAVTGLTSVSLSSGQMASLIASCQLPPMSSRWLLYAIAFGLFAAMIAFILGRQHGWLKELILKHVSRSRELEGVNALLETEIKVRRKAEAALSAGEERLARIVECARDSFFVIAPDGRFVDVNSRACTSTGYSREELLSMSVPDIDIEYDQERIAALFGQMAGGASQTIEGRHRRKDGSTFPVEVNIGLMGDGGGDLAIALARDISERKIVEQTAAYRYECEKLVTEISARFINLPSQAVDRNIELALEQICRLTELDAAYLLLVDEAHGTLSPAHMWQNEKSRLTREALDALCLRGVTWQNAHFSKNEVFMVSSLRDLPPDAGIDRGLLESGSIRSILEVPMIYRGSGVGLFGLVSTQQERLWSEKETGLCRMIGQVFTQALERKRAETALRESEATLASIVRAVPVGIGMAENRRIRQGNRQLFSMVGYTEQDLIGESFRLLYPDDEEFERVGAKIYPWLEKTGRAVVETRWQCKDGKIRDILLNAAVVKPADPPDRITFTALDITERKRAEQALRDSERNYREIFNATQEAIFIHEAETGRTLAVNRTVTEMFGYTEQEACRLSLESISAEEESCTAGRALQMIRMAVEEGPQVFEWLSRKKSGETFWTEVTLQSTEIGGKGRVLAVVRNIDHRKRAERALRESEERFRNLVENAPAGICIVRSDRIIYMNPEQEKIFGSREEVRDIYQLNLHPDDTGKFMQHFSAVRENRQPKSSFEVRLFSGTDPQEPEGTRWVHCDISVIPYEGEPAVLIAMVDMTRTKELEKIIHFREKMVSLGHVAAGIAHEIRNPLSGINVLIDGIRENFEDPESAADIRRLLLETQKASDKIAGVIKRVLDFSRPSQPQLTLTDVNLPVKEALELTKTTLRKAGVLLETDLNESLPPLYIDEQMIEQVVMNLLSNAIEALSGDRPDKRLRVSSRRKNGYVVIDIADSGPGVPDALREKVFDPFYTTRSDGSGIGLSLCQRLIADHGGSISIASSEWGGAEFRIRIPVEKRMAIR